MEKEPTPMFQVNSTTGSGRKAWNGAMEFGQVLRVKITLANGPKTKQTATEYINGKMEIAMRANGANVWEKAKAKISSQMATSTKVPIGEASQKVKEPTPGRTATLIVVSLNTGLNMEKENGLKS